MGAIYRGADEFDLPFTMVPNVVARDRRLSFRARGLLVELLSYPTGWRTSVDALAESCAAYGTCEGRKALQSAMRELRGAGYVTQTRDRDPDTGRFVWSLTVRLPHDVLDEAAKHQPRRRAKAQVSPQVGLGPMAPQVPNGPMDPPAETQTPAGPKPTYGVTCENAQKPRSAHRSVSDLYKKTEVRRMTPPYPPQQPSPARRPSGGGGRGSNFENTPAPTSSMRPRLASDPPRPGPASSTDTEPDREVVSAVVAAIPERYQRAVQVSVRRWWPDALGALTAGLSTSDLATAVGDGWPTECESPTGLVRARLRDATPAEPLPEAQPWDGLAWCGQCDQETRQVELDDGRMARCARCHPLASPRVLEPGMRRSYARESEEGGAGGGDRGDDH